MKDLVISGGKVPDRVNVIISREGVFDHVYRTKGPHKFYRRSDGKGWTFGGHLAKFSDGSPVPPWISAEYAKRRDKGDQSFRDRSTYDQKDLEERSLTL